MAASCLGFHWAQPYCSTQVILPAVFKKSSYVFPYTQGPLPHGTTISHAGFHNLYISFTLAVESSLVRFLQYPASPTKDLIFVNFIGAGQFIMDLIFSGSLDILLSEIR